MSAFRPGNMRGRWEMTPLLLLLLLASLARTVLCQSEDEDALHETEPIDDEPNYPDSFADDHTLSSVPPAVDGATLQPDTTTSEMSSSSSVEEYIEEELGSGDDKIDINNNYGAWDGPEDTSPVSDPTPTPWDEGLSTTVILIPVVLVVVIIGMVVCGIVVKRRWNRKMSDADHRKDDPYLDGCSTEKVPMPMFEEDVPSVLELEMEELDQWLNNDGETAMDPKQI